MTSRDMTGRPAGEPGPMRFILAGVGGFGLTWLRKLVSFPDAELVAVVDPDPAALERARREAGPGPVFSRSLARVLGRLEADALVCVTPPENHRECLVRAMRAGLDTITEKPLAAGMTDCLAILAAARETGRTCAVSQNYRYRPEMSALAGLARQGAIGEIGQGRLEFFLGMDFGGGFRHEMESPLLGDMSIHHFDLLRFVTGLEAVSARAESWNPPWSNYRGDSSAVVHFEMENGARLVYNASWSSKGRFCDWNGNWHIEGSRGTLVYEKGSLSLHDVPLLYRPEGKTVVAPAKMERTGQDFVLEDFIASVRGARKPLTAVTDNILSVCMVLAAARAARTGRRVPVVPERVRELLAV